jgi:hypothetical protein
LFSTAANEHAFRTLAATLGDSLKKIADRLGMKEERNDEEEGEEEEEEEDEEEESEAKEEDADYELEKKNKKNKTTHTAPDESAKEQ